VSDLLGGQVDASFQNINAVIQHIKSGKLKALAITSEARSPLLPEVPTMAEAGVKDVVVYSWQAVVAPKGLSADTRSKVHAAIVGGLNDPQVKQQFVSVGFEVVANTPEQFAKFQQQEFARWKNVIETGKITAD
jgi:tripartite-type tricarboxylate transporter receptor subunit TctC